MSSRLDLPETAWRRVSPRYIVVDVVGYIVFGLVVVGAGAVVAYFVGIAWLWWIVAALAIVFILTISFTPRRVRAIGYQLRDDDVQIDIFGPVAEEYRGILDVLKIPNLTECGPYVPGSLPRLLADHDVSIHC